MINNKEHHNLSAGRLIEELSKAAHIYFQNSFKEYSIGHAQVRTLHLIAHNEGLTQIELSDYLNLDKSSITSQLSILEKNGYITKRISKIDARSHHIYITENTREILKPLKEIYISWTDTLLEDFNESERKQVFLLLKKMQKNVQNKLQEIKEQD